uniref:Uncharacterized protein n=1 Tax=Agrobacterium albertimagni TaxID=147266 RepID=A0A7C1P3X6_9HYPH
MPTFNCNQSCRSGRCSCGAVDDRGVVRDGAALRVGVMFMDHANHAERKPLAMMTDSEIRTMRDSVRGMPVLKAAALPIYDQFRGILDDNGTPMEQMRALYDGATYTPTEPTREECRAAAARDHMIEQMRDAHKIAPAMEATNARM